MASKKKKSKKFNVSCSYDDYSAGNDLRLFATAKAALSRRSGASDASGLSFFGRDHTWCDLTREKATELRKALKKAGSKLEGFDVWVRAD